MLLYLDQLQLLCSSCCDYCIFVEAESIVYDDFNDFKVSHSFISYSDYLDISLCINGPCIQINVSVINNGK